MKPCPPALREERVDEHSRLKVLLYLGAITRRASLASTRLRFWITLSSDQDLNAPGRETRGIATYLHAISLVKDSFRTPTGRCLAELRRGNGSDSPRAVNALEGCSPENSRRKFRSGCAGLIEAPSIMVLGRCCVVLSIRSPQGTMFSESLSARQRRRSHAGRSCPHVIDLANAQRLRELPAAVEGGFDLRSCGRSAAREAAAGLLKA